MTSRTPTVSRRDVGLVTPLSASKTSPLPGMVYGEEVIEDQQDDQNLIMVQELVRATIVASMEQKKLITSQSDVEKNAPKWDFLTRPDYIAFVNTMMSMNNKKEQSQW